jgi:hypothetical protein
MTNLNQIHRFIDILDLLFLKMFAVLGDKLRHDWSCNLLILFLQSVLFQDKDQSTLFPTPGIRSHHIVQLILGKVCI